MMKQYLRERIQREHNAKMTGVLLTLAIHVCAILFVSFSGIKYLYPPAPEQSMLIDFEQDEPEVIQKRGRAPRGEDVDKQKPVELIQRSESPEVSKAQNLTPAAKPDDFGDVETPEPERKEEPKLDPRAAFPGMAKKDTTLTAPHRAEEASSTYKAGQPKGNVLKGEAEGRPNAHLEGRTVDKAGLKKPSYTTQESGTVVVDIWVDQYGKVQKAVPGGEGTTVTDKNLWNAARKAALETGFNMKGDAPAMQHGTITYIFNLR